MIVCGTYQAGKRSCLNCDNFMLWGVSFGHCVKHNEDFPAHHKCSKFRKPKFYLPFKQLYINGIVYDIEKISADNKTAFMVTAMPGATEYYSDYPLYTLRDAINVAKIHAYNL